MKNLHNAANRNSTAASVAVEELRTMRTRIDSLNATLNDLENKNAALSVSYDFLLLLKYHFLTLCTSIPYNKRSTSTYTNNCKTIGVLLSLKQLKRFSSAISGLIIIVYVRITS